MYKLIQKEAPKMWNYCAMKTRGTVFLPYVFKTKKLQHAFSYKQKKLNTVKTTYVYLNYLLTVKNIIHN